MAYKSSFCDTKNYLAFLHGSIIQSSMAVYTDNCAVFSSKTLQEIPKKLESVAILCKTYFKICTKYLLIKNDNKWITGKERENNDFRKRIAGYNTCRDATEGNLGI